jgi:hypothetical protein
MNEIETKIPRHEALAFGEVMVQNMPVNINQQDIKHWVNNLEGLQAVLAGLKLPSEPRSSSPETSNGHTATRFCEFR